MSKLMYAKIKPSMAEVPLTPPYRYTDADIKKIANHIQLDPFGRTELSFLDADTLCCLYHGEITFFGSVNEERVKLGFQKAFGLEVDRVERLGREYVVYHAPFNA